MAARAVSWIPCGTLVGAACGALYGLTFAGLDALLEGETGRIIATTMYFAASGAVAGFLVGGLAAIIHGETDLARDETSSAVVSLPRWTTLTRDNAAPVSPQRVNRLTGQLSVDRRHVEQASIRNAPRN
jgi:hypothetical protein